jgi:hypothetical protein
MLGTTSVQVPHGPGGVRLPIRVPCRMCGELGRLQVRPPVPTRGPGGWMEAIQDI